MPHLSPMNWIILSIFMWLSIHLLNTQNWWEVSKKMNIKSKNMFKTYKKWNW
uniref:ATP synthase F0 subunit 8 n=1 Tax=Calliobdella nodulifera TaxID=3385569 RepID=UPI00207974EF|nr:ATP synthase F0 subunit 8 [Notostomum cyclostomum]URP31054.1 ATP synthase F0 subunit 8 [Notostomum cyclostomum]